MFTGSSGFLGFRPDDIHQWWWLINFDDELKWCRLCTSLLWWRRWVSDWVLAQLMNLSNCIKDSTDVLPGFMMRTRCRWLRLGERDGRGISYDWNERLAYSIGIEPYSLSSKIPHLISPPQKNHFSLATDWGWTANTCCPAQLDEHSDDDMMTLKLRCDAEMMKMLHDLHRCWLMSVFDESKCCCELVVSALVEMLSCRMSCDDELERLVELNYRLRWSQKGRRLSLALTNLENDHNGSDNEPAQLKWKWYELSSLR